MRSETTDRLLTDVAIPPGEHLADTLRELGMNQSELARKMNRPQQAINEIIRGVKAVTAETALQLEDATGVPAYVWVRLEADYRLVQKKLELAGARPAGPAAPAPPRGARMSAPAQAARAAYKKRR